MDGKQTTDKAQNSATAISLEPHMDKTDGIKDKQQKNRTTNVASRLQKTRSLLRNVWWFRRLRSTSAVHRRKCINQPSSHIDDAKIEASNQERSFQIESHQNTIDISLLLIYLCS
ncbi:hypothetical protein DdX_07740 [Ditylenchus destructor]|uniref:Uncharacterized protein n=1 Tax=Ditylenchus destructor TaxID=166010 RepID=A0AAD4N6K5_9BILA|nr:hypothetical protein DdX_07740 [Ditylenchus destructor]